MNNNLDFLMKQKRVGVSQLAREINVSRSTIYRVLDGGTPSAGLMIKLSNYFGKPVNDVFCA